MVSITATELKNRLGRYLDLAETDVDNWRNILSNKLCSLSRRDVRVKIH